jgi:hypothetical protein
MSVFTSDVTVEPGANPIQVDGSAFTQPVSGTVTANAGTGTFLVDGSAHTQPVSGTVTANAGTGTFTIAGTVTANAGTGTFLVDGSAHTQPVSGTVAVSSIGGTVAVTQSTSPWVISGNVTIGGGATATITQVSVTNAVSVTLLASNADRKKAIFTIPTIGTALFIGFAATTNTTTTFTYKLVSNNSVLEVEDYTGVISAIATGTTDVVTITEIV